MAEIVNFLRYVVNNSHVIEPRNEGEVRNLYDEIDESETEAINEMLDQGHEDLVETVRYTLERGWEYEDVPIDVINDLVAGLENYTQTTNLILSRRPLASKFITRIQEDYGTESMLDYLYLLLLYLEKYSRREPGA
jgi:hypothetical protein